MPMYTYCVLTHYLLKHSHSRTHSEEARSNGFTVVVDGDVIHDFLMRLMIKTLATVQVRPTLSTPGHTLTTWYSQEWY